MSANDQTNGNTMDPVVFRGQGLKGDARHPEKARNDQKPQPSRPDWLKVKAPTSQGYQDTRQIVRDNHLVTVCEEAACPNIGECWQKKHATICLLYTSPSPRDLSTSRMPSSA